MLRRGLVALLFCLLLSGCAEPREPGESAIIRLLAIDRAEAGIELSLQVFDPLLAAENAGVPALGVRVLTQRGADLAQALEACRLACGRELYLGDCRLLLLGESLLHPEGLIIELAQRRELAARLPMLRVRGSAGELARLPLEWESFAADELEALYEVALRRQALPPSSLLTLGNALGTPGERALIGVLALDESGAEGVQVKPAGGLLLGGEPERVSETALAGLSLLRGERGRRVLLLAESGFIGRRIELESVRVRTKLRLVGGCLNVRVECRASAALSGDGVLREKARQALKAQLNEALRLTFSPEGGDSWGLSRLAEAQLPEYWAAQGENWSGALRQGSAELSVELRDTDAP